MTALLALAIASSIATVFAIMAGMNIADLREREAEAALRGRL